MINHVTLCVSDLEKSTRFYSAALKPLGYKLLKEKNSSAGFGTEDVDGKRDFWIKRKVIKGNSFSCLAFTASSKQMVEDFYKAAIAAGGKDNGAPGYRKKYYAGYYAAYILDPNGYNIEAVFDDPNSLK